MKVKGGPIPLFLQIDPIRIRYSIFGMPDDIFINLVNSSIKRLLSLGVFSLKENWVAMPTLYYSPSLHPHTHPHISARKKSQRHVQFLVCHSLSWSTITYVYEGWLGKFISKLADSLLWTRRGVQSLIKVESSLFNTGTRERQGRFLVS